MDKVKKTKTKKVEEILSFPDYVFEIDGKDITNTKITYSYANTEVINSPLIFLELSGVTVDDNKDASLCFTLELDLETLNKFDSNKIEDITKYLLESESFVKRPNEDKAQFLNGYLPTNKKTDMFHQLTSLYVFKLDNNKFLFKLTVPSDNIFTYFEINFKN
jgi:hypothetical protein